MSTAALDTGFGETTHDLAEFIENRPDAPPDRPRGYVGKHRVGVDPVTGEDLPSTMELIAEARRADASLALTEAVA